MGAFKRRLSCVNCIILRGGKIYQTKKLLGKFLRSTGIDMDIRHDTIKADVLMAI